MNTVATLNGHVNPLAMWHQSQPALPEAPVSLNAFVEVPVLGKVQITGRGASEAEAVQHLLCAAEQLKLQTAPQGPAVAPSREERLASLLTCGLSRAVSKGDVGLVERLSKAAALVLAGAVEPTERATALAVRSQRDADLWYTVEATAGGMACSCPDWGKHAHQGDTAYACKHVLASWLARKLDA